MSLAELMNRERPWIREIIQKETTLCSERRGEVVDSRDPEVQLNVCQIILEIGADLRKRAFEQSGCAGGQTLAWARPR